ncbi:CGNR zinc finger domain-containing protein [Phytoactinopolyspora endophytica]|uniref:CGNR zinc finger domain-containing protein n=1 Tax=Phytoactinopolyspora endophytica TaxID=1642495 RepID=UPI00101BB824|nr:CGNR zinc finger domain-containing protein [Phytoactinopolyspora endophytica]
MTSATVWVDDHFIAGDIALDFANTVYRRTPELGADLLNNTEALISWLWRARLLPATDDLRSGFTDPDGALNEARQLRAQFWTVFDAQKDGRTIRTDALANLLGTARRGTGSLTVYSDGSTVPLTADGVFAVLALRGITLALNPPSQGVQACDRCGWFFIDTSRGRRRRWCSMKTCGNQSKAARYRATHP